MFSFKILKFKKWVLNFDIQIINFFLKLLILKQETYFLNQIINFDFKKKNNFSNPYLLFKILKIIFLN